MTANPRSFTIFFSLATAFLLYTSRANAETCSQTETLFAGQTIPAGTVTVTSDSSTLCVNYETTGDWYLLETHLHIGATQEDIPQNRKGNPQIGLFDHSGSYDFSSQVQTEEYCVSLADLALNDSGCLVIAGHASVARDDDGDGEPDQGETAWGDGERFVDRGSWATFFTFCPCDGEYENPPGCETAFAYAPADTGTCFLDVDEDGDSRGDFNRWGWTIGELGAGRYSYEIYAGAGRCDITKGTLVGTLDVDFEGSTANVTYNIDAPYTLEETHAYVGAEILPRNVNGDFTVAPGQYPQTSDDGLQNYSFDSLSGDVYVVAHATVCGFPEE